MAWNGGYSQSCMVPCSTTLAWSARLRLKSSDSTPLPTYDVAQRYSGFPLVGPPTHPFRSIEALRAVCLYAADPHCLDLSTALADACWGAGRDLADLGALADVVAETGLDTSNLAARLSATETKNRLRESTSQAIERGVFGVPTCRLGDELFWGHDRLPHLAARIAGKIPDPLAELEQLLERPRGAERRPGKTGR